jgi:hypothetical protein
MSLLERPADSALEAAVMFLLWLALWLTPAAVLRFGVLRRPLGKLPTVVGMLVVLFAALLIHEGTFAQRIGGCAAALTWTLLRAPARVQSPAQ